MDLRAALPNDYELGDFVSAGGQGAVFKGRLRGAPAALKLLFAECDPEFRRLSRELSLLQSIANPHLVRVLDHCEIALSGSRTRVVAYEYIAGGDLNRCLTAEAQPLDESELVRIGYHISVAVDALWARRIVHRDIKPANLMKGDGKYVLVDLGLARHLDRSDLTLLGGAPGTSGFMSPEQASGRRSLTINSDVFSLGVTLYVLASRCHPFDGSQFNINESTFTPLSLRQRRTDLSEPFTRLVHQMLVRRAASRPSRVHEQFARLLVAS